MKDLMKNNYKRGRIKLKNQKIFSETRRRLAIYFGAFATCFIFSFLMNPFEFRWSEFTSLTWTTHLINTLYGLLFAAIICEVSIFIDKLLMKHLPFNNQSSRRIWVQFIFQILGSILFTFLLSLLIEQIWPDPTIDDRRKYTFMAQFLASNIIVSLLLSTFNTVDFLTESWKKTEMEASQHKLKALELQKATLSAELHAMKLQIDPHFIFNNLSVLSELILEDQQLGYEYSESFAKVYRYLLVNSKKDIISLREELKFLNSYIFLTQKRVGEGVIFNIQIEDQYLDYVIPPLVLQLLVENALKHNQTSLSKPLKIEIFTDNEGCLTVQNTISPLINSAESSGVGLKNLINRLEYIGERKTIISKTETEFTAKIPLYENK